MNKSDIIYKFFIVQKLIIENSLIQYPPSPSLHLSLYDLLNNDISLSHIVMSNIERIFFGERYGKQENNEMINSEYLSIFAYPPYQIKVNLSEWLQK